MKRHFIISFLLSALITFSFAQTVSDSVSLGSGSTKMSFYDLALGEQANVNANDWDLQIKADVMTASIRTNESAGVQLYELQNSDTSQWSSVDTAGMTPVYNADSTWEKGAFNAFSTGQFDYGWGDYDQVSHNLLGKKIFVIKTIGGNYKKIWIKSLVAGDTYNISVGNLDNSGESTFTLKKSDNSGKAFFYYAIDAAQSLNIEPAKSSWDIVFRRYLTYVFPIGMYPVTGVLTNTGVEVAEARGVDLNLTDDSVFSYSQNISTIGSDWKTQSLGIVDSLFYFVSTQGGIIYKLVFTGYSGISTGKINFNKTLLQQSTAIEEKSTLQSLSVYPNPASDRLNVLYTMVENTDVTVKVVDFAGKIIWNEKQNSRQGLNNITLPAGEFSKGYYLVSVENSSERLTFKFIKTE